MALPIIPLILGVLGNSMSIFAYASPLPTFWRIVKRRSVEDFNEHCYVLSLLSGMMWTFYGVLKVNGLLIVTVNVIGCAFQYTYLALFMAFSPRHKRMTTGLLVTCVHVVFVGLVLVVELLLHPKARLCVIGVSSCMGAVLMLASPLSIMGTVVRTKSVEYMPFLLSLSFSVRSGTWCAYGFATQDLFIKITSTIGVLLAAMQLVLYMIYSKKQDVATIMKDTKSNPLELVESKSRDLDIHISRLEICPESAKVDQCSREDQSSQQ